MAGPTPYGIPPLQRTVPGSVPDSQEMRYAYNARMPYQNMPQGHLQSRVGTGGTPHSSVRPPMTLETAIPGPMPAPLTILMPTPPPRPEPISAPDFDSQFYPDSVSPSPDLEHASMLQAAARFLQDQSPGPANRGHHRRSRRPRSASRPRALHREDMDESGSKSRSAREGNRHRSEVGIPLPPDYVPVSRADHEQSPSDRRRRNRERSAPPPDRSKAFPIHGGHYTNSQGAQPTTIPNRQAPYDSSHYDASHAAPAHHHGHRHNGHGHNHRHRALSQLPQQQQQHRSHHHQSRAARPSSRPTYARQRSYSVDAGDPRMARGHQTGTFPTRDHNTEHGTGYGSTSPQQYPNYTQQPHPSAHTPSQSSNYRFIVQPPSTTRSDGQSTARGPVGVPRNDQNVQVSSSQHGHNSSAYGGRDSRGRESSPGFWGSLFGRMRRSNSATPGTAHSKNHRHHEYEAWSHHGHGNHRPHNIRRRSSR